MDTLPIITTWKSALQKGQLCSHEHKTSLNILESLLGKAHFEEEIYTTTIFCPLQKFLTLITMAQNIELRLNSYTERYTILYPQPHIDLSQLYGLKHSLHIIYFLKACPPAGANSTYQLPNYATWSKMLRTELRFLWCKSSFQNKWQKMLSSMNCSDLPKGQGSANKINMISGVTLFYNKNGFCPLQVL